MNKTKLFGSSIGFIAPVENKENAMNTSSAVTEPVSQPNNPEKAPDQSWRSLFLWQGRVFSTFWTTASLLPIILIGITSANTDLYEPFAGLQDVVAPNKKFLDGLPDSWGRIVLHSIQGLAV